jgi:hypothetical protein
MPVHLRNAAAVGVEGKLLGHPAQQQSPHGTLQIEIDVLRYIKPCLAVSIGCHMHVCINSPHPKGGAQCRKACAVFSDFSMLSVMHVSASLTATNTQQHHEWTAHATTSTPHSSKTCEDSTRSSAHTHLKA